MREGCTTGGEWEDGEGKHQQRKETQEKTGARPQPHSLAHTYTAVGVNDRRIKANRRNKQHNNEPHLIHDGSLRGRGGSTDEGRRGTPHTEILSTHVGPQLRAARRVEFM